MIELVFINYPINDIAAASALLRKVRSLGMVPYRASINFKYRWVLAFETEEEAALFKLTHL